MLNAILHQGMCFFIITANVVFFITKFAGLIYDGAANTNGKYRGVQPQMAECAQCKVHNQNLHMNHSYIKEPMICSVMDNIEALT